MAQQTGSISEQFPIVSTRYGKVTGHKRVVNSFLDKRYKFPLR